MDGIQRVTSGADLIGWRPWSLYCCSRPRYCWRPCRCLHPCYCWRLFYCWRPFCCWCFHRFCHFCTDSDTAFVGVPDVGGVGVHAVFPCCCWCMLLLANWRSRSRWFYVSLVRLNYYKLFLKTCQVSSLLQRIEWGYSQPSVWVAGQYLQKIKEINFIAAMFRKFTETIRKLIPKYYNNEPFRIQRR